MRRGTTIPLPVGRLLGEHQSMAEDVLVKRCQEHDRNAQAEFYHRYKKNVAKTVYKVFGPDADVDDVIQDVFIEVFRSIGRFKGRSKVSTWLYRVSFNVALQHLRKRKRAPDLFRDEPWDQPDHETPLRSLERKENNATVYDILDTLSEKKRIVLVMHEIMGFAAKEISETLGVNVLTVRTRLHYARKEFYKKMLESDLYKGDEA